VNASTLSIFTGRLAAPSALLERCDIVPNGVKTVTCNCNYGMPLNYGIEREIMYFTLKMLQE